MVMLLSNILNLDCRLEENKIIIQSALRKIRSFSNYPKNEVIPLEKLEKCLKVICGKRNLYVSLFVDVYSSDDGIIYKMEFFNKEDCKKIKECYGITIYECFSKAVILGYSIYKKRK